MCVPPRNTKKCISKTRFFCQYRNYRRNRSQRLVLAKTQKNKEIIIYCRSGARSKTAYDIMKSLGYTNIKSVSGGMIHWEEDKYPFTEKGAYRGGASSRELKEAAAEGPRIAFDMAFHDFGIIPQYGGAVKTVFTIQNNGTDVLEIGTITTSCSCVSASISPASILPGKALNFLCGLTPISTASRRACSSVPFLFPRTIRLCLKRKWSFRLILMKEND